MTLSHSLELPSTTPTPPLKVVNMAGERFTAVITVTLTSLPQLTSLLGYINASGVGFKGMQLTSSE